MTMALSLLALAPPSRADSSATIVVADTLCLPGEEVFIKATLYGSGVLGLFRAGIQGELLRFLDPEGNPLRDLLTDASGLARIRYVAGQPGRYPFTVHLVGNPRYSADPSTGNLFVQDTKLPLLFVTVEEGLMPPRSTSLLPAGDPRKVEPQPGSVKALCDVAPCHVLVYLTLWPRPSSHQIRSWLEARGYPLGPVYFIDRPLLSGIVTKEPAPKAELLESLWKERSVPACLATRDRNLAGAAADKEIRVLLLGSEETNRSVPLGEESEKRITEIEDWPEIAELCRCGTVAGKDTPFHEK